MAITISNVRVKSVSGTEIFAPNENFIVEFTLTNGNSGYKNYELSDFIFTCEVTIYNPLFPDPITTDMTVSQVSTAYPLTLEYGESKNLTVTFSTTDADSGIFQYLLTNDLRGVKGSKFKFTWIASSGSSWERNTITQTLPNAGAIRVRYGPQVSIPALASNQLCKRCDANGSASDEGEYALISAKADLANADGDSLFSASLLVYDESGSTPSLYLQIDDTSVSDFTSDVKTGFLDSTVLLDELVDATKKLSSDKKYHIYLYYQDAGSYEVDVKDFEMPRVFANIHMAGSGAGVAFGMYCTNTGATAAQPSNALFECRYKSKFYDSASFEGGINGVTNYSSGEVDTGGKWIDGKHIYRAIFSSYLSSVDLDRKAKIGTLSKLPTAVLKIYGSANRTGGIFYSIPYINSNVSGSSLSAYVNANGDVYFVAGSGYTIDSSNIMNYSIIVEYAASN